MITVHDGGGGRSSGSHKKEYLYWSIATHTDGELWMFSHYMYMGREYVEPFRKANTGKTTTPSSNKTTTTPSTTTKRTTTGAAAKKPTTVPSKPKAVKQPAKFTMKAPTKVGAFKFTRKEPTLKEVLIPAPLPNPGPEPKFGYEKRKPVTKYEYLMGIKNMEIRHKQYGNKSIFVSKPMEVEGNVMQVSLHSVEEHPVFDNLSGAAADRQTSIEYYVAYSDNPAIDEWYPILPENEKTIKGELLMFDTARTSPLRFPALIGSPIRPNVYRDGLAIDRSLWSFADGGASVQLLTEYEPASSYTIDYTPNAEFYNPWVLDIKERGMRLRKQVDTFPEGTNHNKTVVLSKYPYVDYEKINLDPEYDPNTSEYKPIQVRLKNANIAGQQKVVHREVNPYNPDEAQLVFTKNVTDYKQEQMQDLKPYSINSVNGNPYNGFEYMQEGDKLYFSETFNKADIFTNEQTNHGNAEIEVEYESMVSNFRIKIILRRNSPDTNTLTPIVHEYALKFKVMK